MKLLDTVKYCVMLAFIFCVMICYISIIVVSTLIYNVIRFLEYLDDKNKKD